MRQSVAQRLFGGFVLVFAAGLALIAWQARRIEEGTVAARQREWAFRELGLAAGSIPADALARHDRRLLDAWCDRVGSAAEARLTLIGPDGLLLGDTDVPLDSLTLVENHSTRPEVLDARRTGRGWALRHSHTVGRDLWYVAMAVGPPGPARAVLRLAEPAAQVAAEKRSLSMLLLFALAVVLASAAILAAGAANLLGRRLRAVLRAARRMSHGETGARAPEFPDDEIGRMGRELNQMMASLEARLGDLAEERDQRETILSHLVDGVALLDEHGRVVQANPGLARVLDLPRPPAPGRPFGEEVRQPSLAALLERARASGAPASEELTFFGASQVVVEATVVNLGGGDRPPAQLLVLHDLSRLKQLEKVRQEFVANVSHELKTPLTLIKGSAETLLDGGLEDAGHSRDFVEKIERHAVRLQRIVDDLLQLARMEQPGVRAERRPLNVSVVVRNVACVFESPAAERGLGLELELPAMGTMALGDPELLERALSNLVDNAVKYTARGRVCIATGEEAGRAWIEVRDTGPGIPPESLARIFERFYRVDLGRSRELGGTGLGLSIVRHCVELQGGTVSVRSDLGRGSVFRIELERAGPDQDIS